MMVHGLQCFGLEHEATGLNLSQQPHSNCGAMQERYFTVLWVIVKCTQREAQNQFILIKDSFSTLFLSSLQ